MPSTAPAAGSQSTNRDSPAYRRKIETLAEALGLLLTPEFMHILLLEVAFLIIIGGWRAGKSTVLAFKLFIFIFFNHVLPAKKGLVWLVGPDYEQTDQEYAYLRDWGVKLGVVERAGAAQEGSNTILFRGGCEVVTKSAQHPERLGSVAPHVIGMCEPGQISEDTKDMLIGRALENSAPIIAAGTQEDDEAHEQWAWYMKNAADWLDGALCELADEHDCETEHYSVSWPTWNNHYLFPEGENDPRIQRLRVLYKDNPWYFERKYGAKPSGIQFAVYDTAVQLRPMVLRRLTDFEIRAPVLLRAGGVDFGTTEGHDSVLTVGHVIEDVRDKQVSFVGPKGIVLVRDCRWGPGAKEGGESEWVQRNRKELADLWKVWRWNVDPNERFMAGSFQGEATSYSDSARRARHSLLRSRLNLRKIIIDAENPNLVRLYDQLQRCHYRKTAAGELVYVRRNDDGPASLEDMIEAIDGKPIGSLPPTAKRSYPAVRRKEFARRG